MDNVAGRRHSKLVKAWVAQHSEQIELFGCAKL